MDKVEVKRKDLIAFYKYKRTFVLIDEWGLYFLLIFLYYNSFPKSLIMAILFYGGTALYTSYKNLNKIEQQIVPLDQEIFAVRDVMMLLSDSRKNSLVYWTDHLQPNVQEAWNHITFYRDQIKDYFSLKRQSPFTSTTSNEENK